jgi:hypothetical protein
LVEHLVAAITRRLWVAERVVLRGRLGQPGEQRGLDQGQLRGRSIEEHPGRRLRAVGGLPTDRAVGNGVEVVGKDLPLGHLVRQPLGDNGLLDLALEGLLVAEVEVVGELHRDR